MPRQDVHAHYQLRLVKRIDGTRIVTHGQLAQPKSLNAPDKTMDFNVGSVRAALTRAKDYCRRGCRRKGGLPGEFFGVVLVKHESDAKKSVAVKTPGFEVTKRPKRIPDTTVWLYYVSQDLEAYEVTEGHEIGRLAQ